MATIEQLCGVGRQATVLEIGCGTGELGSLLAKRFAHYVGMVLSLAMLKQVKKHSQMQNTPLVQADGNQSRPVADNHANIIFSSRAIHWINPGQAVKEVIRTTKNTNAMLVIGRVERVERAQDSWESQLRRQCHQLLRNEGLTPRNGGQHLKQLCDQFRMHGAEILTPQTVYHWCQPRTYQHSLNDWNDKIGLAGTMPSQAIKQKILTSLVQWATEQLRPQFPTQAERRYLLHPIKLRPR